MVPNAESVPYSGWVTPRGGMQPSTLDDHTIHKAEKAMAPNGQAAGSAADKSAKGVPGTLSFPDADEVAAPAPRQDLG